MILKNQQYPLSNDKKFIDGLYSCVHCGFCLQVCPTYRETGLETESPRGRIALMKAVNEERITASNIVIEHWDRCVQCRACEIACPSGVPYGMLIETTSHSIENTKNEFSLKMLIKSFFLRHIIPQQKYLKLFISLLYLLQLSKIPKIIQSIKFFNRLFPTLYNFNQMSPVISPPSMMASGQEFLGKGNRKGRVALFTGCLMSLCHGNQMNALVRILTHNGYTVELTENQVCCGAINSHSGDLETSKNLARKNIDFMLSDSINAIIVASAGCGSQLKDYFNLLESDTNYSEKADLFSKKVKDIHEFLVEIPLKLPTKLLNYNVTYQDSCHLTHVQKITDAPRKILSNIKGLNLIEMTESKMCCGAGGIYSITQPELSQSILTTKIKNVRATGSNIVATANPGCVIQLQYGVRKHDLNTEVKYVFELLDQAYHDDYI